MPRYTILLADDDVDFLESMQGILELRGYSVIPAATVEEARGILEQGNIDLAVLDLKLRNPEDPYDFSGARLAREAARLIPKIILTAFPGIEAVRQTLGPMTDGLPAAMDFIEKGQDHEPLIRAIEKGLLSARSVAHRNVFIVHGHDEIKHSVVRFIKDLGLNPIVLVEEPGVGQTIIEQIETYSDVGFVVVLLTPDDVGYARDKPKDKKPRARQNVIFELGYFIGKMGRSKVCSLVKGDVEMPSDYHGIIHIKLDPDEGWKLKLSTWIERASVPVDLRKIVPGGQS